MSPYHHQVCVPCSPSWRNPFEGYVWSAFWWPNYPWLHHLLAVEGYHNSDDVYDMYLIKFPGVLIAIIDPDVLAVYNNLAVDYELLRHNESPWSIWSKALGPLQEASLRDTTILLFGFRDADGVILEVVEDDHLPDPEVLESGFSYCLLEVAVESNLCVTWGLPQHVSIHLDPRGLVEFLRVGSCIFGHMSAMRRAHVVGVEHTILWGYLLDLLSRYLVGLCWQVFLFIFKMAGTTSLLDSCLTALTFLKCSF